MNNDNTVQYQDLETNQRIMVEHPNFVGPVISTEMTGLDDPFGVPEPNNDMPCYVQIGSNAKKQIVFDSISLPETEFGQAMAQQMRQFEEKVWAADNHGLKSGFKSIDDAFEGGIFPGLICIGGDSNLGKSALMSDVMWNLSVLNDDAFVMDYSLDDASRDKISRVAAYCGAITINCAKNPKLYENYPLMLIRRKEAMIKIYNNCDRYVCYDTTHTCFIEDIEQDLQKAKVYFESKNIKKKIVVGIDSFHDLCSKEHPELSDKDKWEFMASWASDLAIVYDIAVICTVELKKLNGNRRPILDDIREAVKIKYEAKAVILVYNEVHYKGEGASIYFTKANNPFKQPIFEMHFAKNKFGSFKGRSFCEFYPDMATLKECSENAQKQYASTIFA